MSLEVEALICFERKVKQTKRNNQSHSHSHSHACRQTHKPVCLFVCSLLMNVDLIALVLVWFLDSDCVLRNDRLVHSVKYSHCEKVGIQRKNLIARKALKCDSLSLSLSLSLCFSSISAISFFGMDVWCEI